MTYKFWEVNYSMSARSKFHRTRPSTTCMLLPDRVTTCMGTHIVVMFGILPLSFLQIYTAILLTTISSHGILLCVCGKWDWLQLIKGLQTHLFPFTVPY